MSLHTLHNFPKHLCFLTVIRLYLLGRWIQKNYLTSESTHEAVPAFRIPYLDDPDGEIGTNPKELNTVETGGSKNVSSPPPPDYEPPPEYNESSKSDKSE